jgi:rhodanese-related sulfurtransferase
MSTYSEIDVNDLVEIMATKPLLLIDVRNDDEVARGIIPGAIHIPLAMLPVQYDALSKVENIVFYCHSGVRSAHAAAFAASKGSNHVAHLIGGVLAWAKAGKAFAAKDAGAK